LKSWRELNIMAILRSCPESAYVILREVKNELMQRKYESLTKDMIEAKTGMNVTDAISPDEAMLRGALIGIHFWN
jgi:hypothetical protein